jgi:predicted nucleic acid-binding protein
MNVAIDTNVFCYAESLNGPEKKAEALALLEKLVPDIKRTAELVAPRRQPTPRREAIR